MRRYEVKRVREEASWARTSLGWLAVSEMDGGEGGGEWAIRGKKGG
jgi:hypothetical protein